MKKVKDAELTKAGQDPDKQTTLWKAGTRTWLDNNAHVLLAQLADPAGFDISDELRSAMQQVKSKVCIL
jgi:hypothetical protein